ncbi:hypothetical protein V3481_016530 [Fusarium oxysporum f. sp. vasinfectum]
MDSKYVIQQLEIDGADTPAFLTDRMRKAFSDYKRTGNRSDIELAVISAQKVLGITEENDPQRARTLHNLGVMLESRYERTGAMGDLEEAIGMARLNNLGNKLESLYEQTKAMDDLEEAIGMARQAFAAMPDDNPNRGVILHNLGNKLERRYEQTKAMGDLEEAISITRQAVAATPIGHPSRGGYLNNLGNKLESRYEQTKAMGDLEEAISVTRQAVTATPIGHPDLVSWLNNLGNKLSNRYERTRTIGDLEEAIKVARQALAAAPDNHPDRAGCLINLGIKLENRYKQTGATADLYEASVHLYEAWDTRTAIPFHRIKAAGRCIKLLTLQDKVTAAAKLGIDIIHLLPSVTTKLLDRTDQQYVVSTFAGVAADLCALLVALNQIDDAVLYLGQGRTVILGQLMDNRSDVSDLAKTHPEIALWYKELRNEVNTPTRSLEQDVAREHMLQQRIQATSELNTCIEEIRRTIPGHERFLLPQTAAEMQECAAGGTIVVVNITEYRSDAILISPTIIEAINLRDLLASDAKAWLEKDWSDRRRAERAAKNRDYSSYLTWLWHSCVKQVLDRLHALHESVGCELFRVWWIGSGLASSMPFHTAGIHDTSTDETAYHKIVSSYTPSIKALAHARQQDKDMKRTTGSLLVVTMPTTPPGGEKTPANLFGVDEEKKTILQLSKEHMSEEVMVQPSVDQVLPCLQHCCIAHFACHGWTEPSDPSKSGLILQRREEIRAGNGGNANDNEDKVVQDRLTVGRISEMKLKHARLAYLSACSTAQNKAEELSDEVIHVVSGFQVAGFPHVVGCLWPAKDRVCVEVASLFYSSLFGQAQSQWKDGKTAWALREAVLAVRTDDIEMPLNWAQFVHYGL